MHEMSIAESLLQIIRQEMEKNDVQKLIRVTVKHGKLAAIVPESLTVCFEILTKGTDLEGAVLDTEEIPLVVKCAQCGKEFTPDGENEIFMPCPECDMEFGHEVLSGKELYLDHFEAE